MSQWTSDHVRQNVTFQGRQLMLRGLCAVAKATQPDAREAAAMLVLAPCVDLCTSGGGGQQASCIAAVSLLGEAARHLFSVASAPCSQAIQATWHQRLGALYRHCLSGGGGGSVEANARTESLCQSLRTIMSASSRADSHLPLEMLWSVCEHSIHGISNGLALPCFVVLDTLVSQHTQNVLIVSTR
jgi:hypothetical protein